MSQPRARLAALDGVLIAAGVAGFGLVTGAFTGAVKGYDGWGHLTKVVLLLRDFPAVDWNYNWYSGSPFFLGGYPPLFYGLAGALVWMGVDQMVAMDLLIALSYIAMTVALYAVVRMVTGARLAGLIAAGLLIGTPALWTPYIQAGLYTRVFGMAFTSLAFALAVSYLRRPSFARYLWCLLAVWSALNSHVVLGALAVLSVGLVLVLTPDRDGHRRSSRALLLVPPVLLSAYYYVPLAFYPQGSQVSAAYPALAAASLVALIPVLPVALLAVIAWLRFRSPDPTATARLMLACGIVCAACLLYAFVTVPRLAGLRTPDMLFFVAWFLAATAGLAIGSIRVPAHRLQRAGAVTVLVAATLASMVAVVPFLAQTMVVNPLRPQDTTAGWQPVGPTDQNFRIASPSDNLSVWLSAVYDDPQTRGYAAIPQIANPDWQYWFDTTVWNQAASEQQRTFLLDWYGVRWIYVPAPYLPSAAGVVAKLGLHPDLYQAVPPTNSGRSPSLTYAYLRPAPVALATGAPTVLVVGAAENYQLVFRDLSYSGFDSSHVIPVQGGAYVDDYTIQDLSRFDEVLIYGGGAHDTNRALHLLATYVRSGGGLVVEASGSTLGSAASEPLPITGLTRHDRAGDWLFKAESSPVTDGIDFGSFGAPRYGGGPWTVSAASGVRSWAQTVLTSGNDAVVVAGQLGQGRVVWSGLNLPFHVDSYRSAEESRFLTSAMSWASRSGAASAVTSSSDRVDPQDMKVRVEASTRGVLFKESWFDRWHAYVNGREASIDRVGPGFMYVTLPAGTSFPVEVEWRYQKSAVDWSGIGLSVATLVALVSWPRWRLQTRRFVRGWVGEEPS